MYRSVNYAEMFYLVDAGEGRWVVKHTTTNQLARNCAPERGLAVRWNVPVRGNGAA
jgi:hypothetical protein